MKYVAFIFILLFGVSCSHYQSSLTSFRGPGEMNGGYRDVSRRPARASGDFALTWPVKNIKISQPYRPRRNKSHQGLDLRGSRNTPIVAAHPGRVIYVGQGFRGYGKMVMVEYNGQWASLYAHLNKIDVRQGDYVEMGDVLGGMGRTGRTTGVHLHFELLKNKLPVDPLNYLPDTSRIASH